MSLYLFSPFSIIYLLSPQFSPSISAARNFSSLFFPFLRPSHILLSTVARSHPYKSFNPELSLKITFFFSNQVEESANGPDNTTCFQCKSICVRNLPTLRRHTGIRYDSSDTPSLTNHDKTLRFWGGRGCSRSRGTYLASPDRLFTSIFGGKTLNVR